MTVNALTHTHNGIANEIITPVSVKNLADGKEIKTQGIWDTGATGGKSARE